MKQIRIKDNESRKKEDFYIISNLVKSISDKTFEQLEKEGVFVFPELLQKSEDITKDQMILQSINDSYRSGNVMGFLGYGEERLVIESRFCGDREDYLFQYLLEKVMDFPNILKFETDSAHDDRMFSLLLFLFPSYLSKAMRKGLYKTYIRKEYNDENVKGTININRHLKSNIPFVGKIAYDQREYQYDNYLMQLVRHTIEYIRRKPYGNKMLMKVKDEVKLVIDATESYEAKKLQRIIAENKKNTIRHAYYHEYRALQRLCVLILQGEKSRVGSGTRRTYGVLFDGAWLWEEYINSLVEEYFYHPKNKGGKGAQWLFAGNKGLIYPDFIGKDKNERVIADAKYKPIDNIGNRDYLQVLAYMYRFESKKAFYFYPEIDEKVDKKYYLNRGSLYENNVEPRNDVCLIKHGLKIPIYANSYEEFVESIKQSEKAFVNDIINMEI